MGCASSKRKRCPHCQNPMTRRSYSMHDHQPPPPHADSHHVVAFSSSTLGSLKLDNKIYTTLPADETKNQTPMGLLEAKTWSNMIDERIPKIIPRTPIRTPPGEPETVNIWEVMEGLEDISPFRATNRPRSFSFDVGRAPISESFDELNPKALKTTDFDPDVISSFRKSLEELQPDDPFHLRSLKEAEPAAGDPSSENKDEPAAGAPAKAKVVVYFTSLRGVRKTYEDCCDVRVILRAIGARVDERDVSMDSGFKQELKELLGDGYNGGGLPKVFVGENFIGGAEEIRRLHEDGQLEKLLERCMEVGGVGSGGECGVCGDVRFVPCESCSGSCKIYYGEDEEEEEEGECGFRRCLECNENGLIRCPVCCS